MSLYPNPAREQVVLALPAHLGRQPVSATLVDALGRTMRTLALPAQRAHPHSLDLRELAPGVYTLHLRTEAGLLVKKLVIE